jgi:hypothetical protein
VSTYLECSTPSGSSSTPSWGWCACRLSELLAVVRLYKALGGGWQEARAQ